MDNILSLHEIRNIPIVFIIGKGRSGTTLLQTMLDAHSNICFPFESRFIIHLYSKYRRKTHWSQSDVNEFLDDLSTERRYRLLWKADRERLEKQLIELGPEIGFGDVCKCVYLSHKSLFEKGKIKLIGDKNPIYTLFMDQIREVFPESKIIHMIRDPRANVSSHIKSFGTNDWSMIAYKWIIYNKIAEKYADLGREQYQKLFFRDLVSDSKNQLQRICKFLTIDFQDSMIDYHKAMNENYEKFKWFFDTKGRHRNLLKPVDPKVIDKWKTHLSPKMALEIEDFVRFSGDEYSFFSGGKEVALATRLNYWKSKRKNQFRDYIVKIFFLGPFWVRKLVFSVISKVSDKNYK